jgi:hypothetical protein
MTDESESFEVEDSSNLTDADWAEINNLQRKYKDGGQAALSKEMKRLATENPVRYITVLGAFFPDMIREALRDSIAEMGMDEDDIRELIRRLESPVRDQ